MKEALLLVEGESPRDGGSATLLHWSLRETPAGVISVPALVDARLLQIRAEHAAWAHEMGSLRVAGRALADWLPAGGGLSMWWCSLPCERHPRLLPHLYELYKLRALELELKRLGIRRLRVQGAGRRLRLSLAEFCSAAGLDFAGQGAPGRRWRWPGLRGLYALTPAPLRAGARFLHWLASVRRRLPYAGDTALEGAASARPDAAIVTYFPNIDLMAAGAGRFRSRYWESLQDALNAEARREKPAGGHFVRWVFIRFPSPDLSFGQCLRLRDTFRQSRRDGASFHYLEEFLRARDICIALMRHAGLLVPSLICQRAFRRACHLRGSHVNFWRQMQWAWAESFRGWRGLERCLQNQAFLRWAALAPGLRWLLFPLENCPWERMLCQAWHRRKEPSPIIGAQHSAIRRTDFRYFDDPRAYSDPGCALFQPDLIRANGQGAYAQWLDAGLPQDRLGQVEALRYLYLAGRSDRAEPGRQPPFPTALELARAMGRKGRLLVLTSFFRQETEEHLELLARALRQGMLDSWELTVKAHPCLPARPLLEKLLGPAVRRLNFSEGALAQELAPGVTVWCSNSTTAALEAALLGLPLMVMQARDDFDLCPIQDLPGLARTGSLADLERALARPLPVAVPPGYLDLDKALPRWRALLGLEEA